MVWLTSFLAKLKPKPEQHPSIIQASIQPFYRLFIWVQHQFKCFIVEDLEELDTVTCRLIVIVSCVPCTAFFLPECVVIRQIIAAALSISSFASGVASAASARTFASSALPTAE